MSPRYDIPNKCVIFATNYETGMKKTVLMIALAVLALSVASCKKVRYCKCTSIQNDEVIDLGEDYYYIEDGSTCTDRSREIQGWGQVVCREISKYEATGEENKWWENLFNLNVPK